MARASKASQLPLGEGGGGKAQFWGQWRHLYVLGHCLLEEAYLRVLPISGDKADCYGRCAEGRSAAHQEDWLISCLKFIGKGK